MNFSFFINWRSTRWNILKSIYCKLSKYWALEFNFYATHSWILIDAKINPLGSHRGFFVMLGLLGFAIDLNIYDVRHNGLDDLETTDEHR